MKFTKLFLVLLVIALALTAKSNFEAQTIDEVFTVTIQKVGNGAGVVVSSPPGIDCGTGFNDCSAQFARGTSVTLRPRALHGPSTFSGWSIGIGSTIPCAGSRGACHFIVMENSAARAEFIVD